MSIEDYVAFAALAAFGFIMIVGALLSCIEGLPDSEE